MFMHPTGILQLCDTKLHSQGFFWQAWLSLFSLSLTWFQSEFIPEIADHIIHLWAFTYSADHNRWNQLSRVAAEKQGKQLSLWVGFLGSTSHSIICGHAHKGYFDWRPDKAGHWKESHHSVLKLLPCLYLTFVYAELGNWSDSLRTKM